MAPLLECIEKGITPVISPTARGEDGKVYNCNADVAAAQAAITLKSPETGFHERCAGVASRSKRSQERHFPDTGQRNRSFEEIGSHRQGHDSENGQCGAAIKAGVEKVFFVDGRLPHAILLEIFTDAGVGTELVSG